MLDDLRFRLRILFRRGAVEGDLDEELRFHLDRAADRHVARGLPRDEAYRRARITFGPLDVIKDDCRQSWGIRQLDVLREDVAFALRLMRRQPVLSAVATASLAIGIGLNAALFALLDATLLRRLAVDRPEQLVDVYVSNDGGYGWYGSSYPDYLDLGRGAPALTGLAGHVPAMAAVVSDGESRARPGEAVTGNYFQVLGVRAAHGRTLLPDDDRPGAAPVVVISSALWAAAYDRDPHAVGRALRIGRRSYTIVGVAPESFSGMAAPVLSAAFWMPIARVDDVQPVMMQSGSPAPGATRLESRGLRWMLLKGRLREGGDGRRRRPRVEPGDARARGNLPGFERRAARDRVPDKRRGDPPVARRPLPRGRSEPCRAVRTRDADRVRQCGRASAGAGVGPATGDGSPCRAGGEPGTSGSSTAGRERPAGCARRGGRRSARLGPPAGPGRGPRAAAGSRGSRPATDRPHARRGGRSGGSGRRCRGACCPPARQRGRGLRASSSAECRSGRWERRAGACGTRSWRSR